MKSILTLYRLLAGILKDGSVSRLSLLHISVSRFTLLTVSIFSWKALSSIFQNNKPGKHVLKAETSLNKPRPQELRPATRNLYAVPGRSSCFTPDGV